MGGVKRCYASGGTGVDWESRSGLCGEADMFPTSLAVGVASIRGVPANSTHHTGNYDRKHAF